MTLARAQLVAFAGATDLDRAREFYAGVLGLPLVSQDGFACVFKAGDWGCFWAIPFLGTNPAAFRGGLPAMPSGVAGIRLLPG